MFIYTIILFLFFITVAYIILDYTVGDVLNYVRVKVEQLTGIAIPFIHLEFLSSAPEHIRNSIFKQNKYYRKLSLYKQRAFAKRTFRFMQKKKFVGRGGLVVTEDMQLTISIYANMVSFGLNNYMLNDFDTIIIYPDDYVSNITGNRHKGEVNTQGVIVLSWESLRYGVRNDTDGENLLVHEFAHAYLHTAEVFGGIAEPSIKLYLPTFYTLYNNEEYITKLKKVNSIREYAFTNYAEFFAVACEYFFETPKTFKQDAPQLYSLIAKMLNQDTAKMGL